MKNVEGGKKLRRLVLKDAYRICYDQLNLIEYLKVEVN